MRKKIERGSGDERLRREITLYGGLLQRGRELEFNFRVNLIWMGWVNFFGLGCFLMDMPCHIIVVIKKNYMSIKNCPRHNSVSYVYTKLTETNGRTNGASF